ncbi:MAG: hypothetical protein ABIY52_04115 [Gemmatimonadaceae bacterium]
MRRSAVFTILLACATRAGAQAAPNPDAGVHVSPALGVHYGSPLRFSASAGVLVDLNGNRNDGVVVMAELGQRGYEGSLGYFRMLGKFGSGYSMRAAVLRTTDDPWNASEHTTYAGVEGHWMIAFGVGGRVGYLRRVSTGSNQHDNLASLGLSIGL